MNVNGNDITVEVGASTETASKKIEKMSSLLDRFSHSAKATATTLGKLSAAVAGAGAKVVTLPFKKTAKDVSALTSKVGQLGAAFKRVVFYRAIRTIIKEIGDAFRVGTQNLYYYSQEIGGQFAASMDTAATSMLYFKNSIGAAVAPIVNVLAPVLDMLVDKIVDVINAINQLFAKLTGAATWTKALKYPKAYGDAMSGAGRKAKDALKYLAPFDELNVLPSERSSGSGGSALAEDYASMFEEMTTFADSISDFAERVKDAIKRADWKSVGTLIGEKANEVIDSIPWSGIGTKVGSYINGWFTTKYWTLETINFTNLGGRIAELLNNTLSNIDFITIGRALSRGFTIIFDFVIGFVRNLDWRQVGRSVGDYLRGAFNEISDWSKTVDWQEFGDNLWQDVKDFIAGIDFASLADSFFEFLGSAFGAAVAAIGGFFKGVWEDVSEYFRSKTEEAGGDTWEGFKKGVVDAWNNVTSWIEEHIVDPFIDGVKKVLGIHSPSTVMEEIGENTMAGFKNGLSNKWEEVKSWWQKLDLGSFYIKTPHLSWYTEPAYGWMASVLSALGLPASVPKLSVSWYAKGGIVDKASLIGAGEAGREAIVPLERNTQWVGMVANQLASQMGGRYGSDLAGDLEDANGVVVSAIFSATAEIVKAMQRNNGGTQSNFVDIDQVARQVTRWQQNTARANG